MRVRYLGLLMVCTVLLGGCIVVPIPIPLGATTGGAQQPAAPALRGDALRSALAGRTLSGQGQTIALASNGTTRLDLGWTQTTGTWRIDGDNLCMTAEVPGTPRSETCSRAQVNGSQVVLTDPGNGPSVTYALR